VPRTVPRVSLNGNRFAQLIFQPTYSAFGSVERCSRSEVRQNGQLAVDQHVRQGAELRNRANYEFTSRQCVSGVQFQFSSFDGFLDFRRVRHLLRGVADEQRHHTDHDGHPG
jgi:hypothetical protein